MLPRKKASDSLTDVEDSEEDFFCIRRSFVCPELVRETTNSRCSSSSRFNPSRIAGLCVVRITCFPFCSARPISCRISFSHSFGFRDASMLSTAKNGGVREVENSEK
jgi:hypothetical protein